MTTQNRPQAPSSNPARRKGFGIAGRLFLAFGVVSLLTLLAGGTAWISFQQVRTAFDQTADETVPAMAEAFRIKADAGSMNAAAPRLANAGTEAKRSALESTLGKDLAILRQRLDVLQRLGTAPETLAEVTGQLDGIDQAMARLNQQVALRLQLADQRGRTIAQVEAAQKKAFGVLVPLVKRARLDLTAQTSNTTKSTTASIQGLLKNEVRSLKTDLQTEIIFANIRTAVSEGLSAKQARGIDKADGRVEALLAAFQQSLDGMSEKTAALVAPQLAELLDIFDGEDAIFEVQKSLLKVVGSERARAQVTLLKQKRRLRGVDEALTEILGASVLAADDQVTSGSLAVTQDNERSIESLIQRGVGRMTNLLKLQADVNLISGLIIQGAITDRPENVDVLFAAFDAARKEVGGLLSALRATGDSEILSSNVTALLAFGTGAQNAFTVRKQELKAIAYSEEALSLARASASQLNVQVDQLIAQAEAQLSGATQDVSGAIDDSKTAIALIVLASVVIGLLIAWLYVGRNLVARLSRLSRSMGEISSGDLSAAVPEGGSDEITDMGHALAIFRDSLSAAEVERRENEAQREAASQQRRVEMLALADNFDASVKGVVESVSSSATQMQATAGSMSTTADQTNQQAGVVASAADVTTGDVQMAAAAAQELSNSIDEIGRQVNRSNEIATEASTRAQQTNQEIEGLAVAANKIGEVVNLIQEIAEQTNLLALNATIEAARAGDAGKGFAVVASEVKSLANQTAKATEEIGSQIGGMQTATGEAVTAIKTIGRVIEQMNEISTSISAAVEEQGAATQEIASTMQRVSEGTQSVSTNISGVSRAAGETGQSANEVLAAADEVARQSETLRGQVEGFLAKIRAA